MSKYEMAFKDLVNWIKRQDQVIEDGKKFGVVEGDNLIPGVEQTQKMLKRAIGDVISHYHLDMKI